VGISFGNYKIVRVQKKKFRGAGRKCLLIIELRKLLPAPYYSTQLQGKKQKYP